MWVEITGASSDKLMNLGMELEMAYGLSDSAGIWLDQIPTRDMQWLFETQAEAEAQWKKIQAHPLPEWAKLEGGVYHYDPEEIAAERERWA